MGKTIKQIVEVLSFAGEEITGRPGAAGVLTGRRTKNPKMRLKVWDQSIFTEAPVCAPLEVMLVRASTILYCVPK